MCKQPAMRAPLRGCSSAYFSRVAMRPGISCSASSISRRPKAARLMSATLYCLAGSEDMVVVLLGGCGRKRCEGRWRRKKRTMGSEKGKVQLMYRRGAGQALGGSFSQANQAPRRQLRSLSAKSHLPTKGRSTLPLRAPRLNPTEFLSLHRFCLFFAVCMTMYSCAGSFTYQVYRQSQEGTTRSRIISREAYFHIEKETQTKHVLFLAGISRASPWR